MAESKEKNEKAKEFISLVREAEREKRPKLIIRIELASMVAAFIERILQGQKTGGANSKKNQPLSNDPKAIANRERVRRFREKNKKD